MIICPSCSAENPDTARFCHACGGALEAPAAPAREERKVVTVLFADLVGFTARAEQLDPEDVRGLLAPYHAHLRGELERFGGTVEKFIGDAVVALFGAPTAHEDDPERAVRAALAIRDWVTQEGNELQLRVAVNTGEALIALGARPAEGEGMASGDVINTAARLQSAAPVNGILVGETTYRATSHSIKYREAEAVEAKGKTAPIRVWEAVEARSRVGVDLPQARAPLVGREGELDSLRHALERSRSQRQLQLVTLVGVPGIGKSRLVHELFQLVEAEPEFTTWRQGRSLPYGEGVSFWALAEIVKAQAGILESDSEEEAAAKLESAVAKVTDAGEADWMASRLRSLVGLQVDERSSAPQSESFSAWRSFLEALADDRPLVLVFEDLHWADDGLLDFVDELVEWARSAPIFVVCTARPELLERRPGWGGGKANAATISLPPLQDEETALLFASLLERAVLPAETQAELLARAAGNPLYAEQYARMLAERGDVGELDLPETVQGIIAARLDGLSEAEKALLQDAAVVGKVFWLGAVCAIGVAERDRPRRRCGGWSGRSSCDASAARRSRARPSTRSATCSSAKSRTARSRAPHAPRSTRPRPNGSRRSAVPTTTRRCSPRTTRARSSTRGRSAVTTPGSPSARDTPCVTPASARLRSKPGLSRRGSTTSALELWPEDDPELSLLRFKTGRARFHADGTGIELVKAGIDGLPEDTDPEIAAEALVSAALLYWNVGESEQQHGYLQRALELVGDREDSPAKVTAMTSLAANHMLDGDYPATIDAVNEVLPAAERMGLDELQIRLLNLRGNSRVNLGDEGGFEDFRRSIARANETQSFNQLQSALNNLMTRRVALGQLEEARETFGLLQANLARSPTHHRRGWVMTIQAELSYSEGNWHEALELVEGFIAEMDAGSPHYLESAAHELRGSLRLAFGDRQGAAADSKQALEAGRRTGDGQLDLRDACGPREDRARRGSRCRREGAGSRGARVRRPRRPHSQRRVLAASVGPTILLVGLGEIFAIIGGSRSGRTRAGNAVARPTRSAPARA